MNGFKIKSMSFVAALVPVCVVLFLAAVLLMIVRPVIVALVLPILLVFSRPAVLAYAYARFHPVIEFVQKHARWFVAIQCIIYALAYNSLMPEGMYFSPDSVQYLLVSNLAPPTFSLLARALLEFELGLGSSTHIVLLRYIVIVIYCIGGWLIARALIRSGRPIFATLVLPTLWSMSALTMWFNYYLTDGIATAFLIACIGAYANMHVSIQEGYKQNRSSQRWLVLFVLLGMISFSLRPAFAFVAPVMVMMMMNRALFSWRRLAGVMIGVMLLATAHFSFAKYWHGEVQSKLGGVLTALVFDLPLPAPCSESEKTNLCNTQLALEPFIRESLSLAPQQRFIYKALNNGNVFMAAMSAVREGNENSEAVMTAAQEEKMYTELKEIAFIKIKSNVTEYISTVLKNSYYSVKTWGNGYVHDHLGSVAMQGVTITNENAAAVRAVARVDFDPTIKNSPIDRFYKDYLFQTPRLVLNGHIVADYTLAFLVLILTFSVLPFIFPTSVPGSILFACCLFGIAGIISQNAVFPVIPRLLGPFQPLAALGALMLILMAIDKRNHAKQATQSANMKTTG